MTVLRRILAVVTGFATVAVLSVGTDAVLHKTGIFPATAPAMTTGLFALAATYRAVFTVLGGVIATVVSDDRNYRPALILSGLGFLGGLAGVGAWFTAPDLGPLWYPVTIWISAIPCTLLGAWLVLRRRD